MKIIRQIISICVLSVILCGAAYADGNTQTPGITTLSPATTAEDGNTQTPGIASTSILEELVAMIAASLAQIF